MKPTIRKTLLALLALILIGAGAAALWLRTSLPQTTGTVDVADLKQPVEIIRDENGIPHIFAQTKRDAHFALGFVHAQDRLWQMEFTRRVGAGRLSEILGRETLGTDKFLRTLGLYRLAESQAARLDGETREALDGYAAGVNAFLANHRGAWPLEFILLGHTPEPWRPADSLVWAKLMGLQLSSGWRGDLLRANLAARIGVTRLRDLFPVDGPDAPTTLSQMKGLRLDDLAARIPDMLDAQSASNAWVVSGARSATGKPILANDPHLGFAAPGLWYLARLTAPGWTATGATAPGVPLVVLGRNGHIAWGMTTTGGDTSDLFIETALQDDPTRYLTPDGPKAFRTRTETISIKGDDPITITVRETRHGPVLSDVLPALKDLAIDEKVVALAATVLRDDDTSVEAIARINLAKSVTEFRTASRLFSAPMQNLFVADISGGIGFITAGRMPLRRMGHGHLPESGLDGRGDWKGFVAARHWPQSWNPPEGVLANANNRLRPSDEGRAYQYAWYWPESHRAARIKEFFRVPKTHTIEDSLHLQMDNRSLAARSLLPILIGLQSGNGSDAEAISLLRDWNYEMDRRRPEPLLYAAWTRHLMVTLLEDELGAAFAGFQRARPRVIERILREDTVWCDDVSTPQKEDCGVRTALALDRALSELKARFGGDPKDWNWGAAHEAVFPHKIFRRIPLLGQWTEGRIATDGGDHTLNRGQTGGGVDDPYRHSHGAGFRAVYDLSNLENSRYSLATGQSGNPLSDRYMEFLAPWRDGRYIHIAGSRDELETRGGERLTLRPRVDREQTESQ